MTAVCATVTAVAVARERATFVWHWSGGADQGLETPLSARLEAAERRPHHHDDPYSRAGIMSNVHRRFLEISQNRIRP